MQPPDSRPGQGSASGAESPLPQDAGSGLTRKLLSRAGSTAERRRAAVEPPPPRRFAAVWGARTEPAPGSPDGPRPAAAAEAAGG